VGWAVDRFTESAGPTFAGRAPEQTNYRTSWTLTGNCQIAAGFCGWRLEFAELKLQ
jgi:hypothetical protein